MQEDLNKLFEWSHNWQMVFNVANCHVFRQNEPSFYVQHEWSKIKVHKGGERFGSPQYRESQSSMMAYKKANRALGMISHVISYTIQAVLLTLYKSLGRPHLEYCTPAWSPHYAKDKILFENVQHKNDTRTTELSYEDLLDILGLWSLQEKRNRA